jgi:hypothetical protein
VRVVGSWGPVSGKRFNKDSNNNLVESLKNGNLFNEAKPPIKCGEPGKNADVYPVVAAQVSTYECRGCA